MTKEEIVDWLDQALDEITEQLWESRPVVQDDDELREDPCTRIWAKVHALVSTAVAILDEETAEPGCTVEEVEDAHDR